MNQENNRDQGNLSIGSFGPPDTIHPYLVPLKMIIYKATCIRTGKSYIGKTNRSLFKRKIEHQSAVIHNSKFYFHNALRKYGIDNFKWEVIDQCLFPDILLELEKHYIKEFNSKIPHGYNLTDGGEGTCGHVVSPEARKKISIANKGYHHSIEAKIKISLALKGNKYSFGIHPSLETRKKISVTSKGRLHSSQSKAKISLANTGKQRTAETKMKLSLANKGKKHSLETIKKMQLAHKGIKNHFFGKHHTPEANEKNRQAHLKTNQINTDKKSPVR